MKDVIIGIDLGGTNCRFGVVSKSGEILKQEMLPVSSDRSHKGIVEFLSSNCKRLSSGAKLLGVGVGAPGIVDFEKGAILRSPHYPEWLGFSLRDELQKKCGCKVVLDNDANMIASGEAWKGAGRGLKNFIMLTIGTGIGGGIVIDGKIFRGDHGFAGEIGHQIIQFDGVPCDCGGKGCFETIVSIGGLQDMIAGSKYAGITAKELYDLAAKGDSFALSTWKKFGSYLGAGIASVVNVLGIHTVIIGGGISNAWDLFIDEAKKEIGQRTYAETAERIVLKKAELGESAGILGSVSQVLKM